VLPPGVPAVPEYYDRNKYWPKESLERRDALLAARPRWATRCCGSGFSRD